MHTLRHSDRFVIRPRKPYSLPLTIRKPAGWSWLTPFEVWERDTIWTGFWFPLAEGARVPIGIRVHGGTEDIVVDVFAQRKLSAPNEHHLREMLTKALGAREDIRPLYALMRKDKVLKHLVRRLYGMREGWGSDIFPSLTLAVLLQMAPIKRSQEMWHCLIQTYGAVIRFDGHRIRLWPTEESIARRTPRELKRCKLGYRAKNLIKLARQLVQGFPTMEDLAAMTPEQANEKLLELYGVGEYSAGFATPHPSFTVDVWSVKIFHQLLFGKPAPKKDPRSAIPKVDREAEKRWGPWRGYVFAYVLNDLPYLEKTFGIKAE